MQDTLHIPESDSTHHSSAHATDSASVVVHTRVNARIDSLKKNSEHFKADYMAAKADTVQLFSSSVEGEKQINIWQHHELKQVHDSPRQIHDTNPDWMFLLILFVLTVLTYLRIFYRKNLMEIISACFNNNLTNQIVRDENLLVQRASIMLNVTFSIIAASFIFLVSVHYNWSLGGINSGFSRFVFLTLIVSAAFTLKFLVLRFCGFLFNLERETATYIFNIFIINNLLGIILIPFIALILFGNIFGASSLIIEAVCLILIAYLYRIGRGILIAVRYTSFSPVYLFLYLCALEISPLLVLIKFISKQ